MKMVDIYEDGAHIRGWWTHMKMGGRNFIWIKQENKKQNNLNQVNRVVPASGAPARSWIDLIQVTKN